MVASSGANSQGGFITYNCYNSFAFQKMATRPVLRIFISSTAVDLIDYRDKVRDAVLRLESLPIAMETFSAKSGQPAGESIRMPAEPDPLISSLPHRYAYLPP